MLTLQPRDRPQDDCSCSIVAKNWSAWPHCHRHVPRYMVVSSAVMTVRRKCALVMFHLTLGGLLTEPDVKGIRNLHLHLVRHPGASAPLGNARCSRATCQPPACRLACCQTVLGCGEGVRTMFPDGVLHNVHKHGILDQISCESRISHSHPAASSHTRPQACCVAALSSQIHPVIRWER